ncbi:major facilitator superfamily-domain-containing protein [Pyronema domesticum]|uniref:Similar to Siderophore iron transporter mirC acc. no. Q870L3 n=1 Tax=Pyronema omphalodes (strain CBS 100304) TaxID=1076935 RepID=U4LGA3_PYROM|nr:major facilitator superfamily-domain-containing protein [Pyronema domesticum]CCX15014.1 Similar to Siderophore iron transporter mirC; acc. no. Q870L3 [Pyronema omphalodes CBS 100304]
MTLVDIEAVPQQQTGVARSAAISRTWTRRALWIAYGGMFLMCLSTSLDAQSTINLNSFATSSFKAHSLLSTVSVITNILNAVMQPPIAKLADVFGRTEAFTLGIILYIIGCILASTSGSIGMYAFAKLFDAAGNTSLRMLQQVFIADTSDLLNRALMSSVPDIPYLATVWIGPFIGGPLGDKGLWRWGFGMWAIITPIMSAPLFWSLWRNSVKAKKMEEWPEYPWKGKGCKAVGVVCKEIDLIGMILLTAGFALLLGPLTLGKQVANGWADPRLIACFILGGLCLIAFPFWETSRFTPYPIVPFSLFKNRTVMCGCLLGFFYFMAFFLSVQPYFFSYLVVAHNLSATAAGHITQIFSFSCTVTVLIIGTAIKYTKVYKPYLVVGIFIYSIGILLMMFFRNIDTSIGAIIGIQIMVGIGGGFINVPCQLGIQASVSSQDVGCATAVFLTMISLGGAVGSAISGAIWSSLLKRKLQNYLPTESLPELELIYGDFNKAASYGMETATRTAVRQSYDETMHMLLIVAICSCIPLLPLGVFMRGLKLDTVEVEDKGIIIGGGGKKEEKTEVEEVKTALPNSTRI